MQLLGVTLMLVAGLATAGSTAEQATAGPTKSRSARPRPAANRTFIFTAHDFAYTGLPARLPAGWVTLRMVNAGRELHMFATSSVPRGYTTRSLETGLLRNTLPDSLRLEEWGGPNAVAPGDTATVSLFLRPGSYVVGCFVPSADGKLHIDKGMIASFEVAAAADTGAPPPSDGRIMLRTYGIALVGGPPKPGMRTFLVRNTAKETHDVAILKVLPGRTVSQALAWFRNPGVGVPAAVSVGGTTGIHTDDRVFVRAHLTPGRYVLVCWMSTKDKYHFDLGMQQAFTVPAA